MFNSHFYLQSLLAAQHIFHRLTGHLNIQSYHPYDELTSHTELLFGNHICRRGESFSTIQAIYLRVAFVHEKSFILMTPSLLFFMVKNYYRQYLYSLELSAIQKYHFLFRNQIPSASPKSSYTSPQYSYRGSYA